MLSNIKSSTIAFGSDVVVRYLEQGDRRIDVIDDENGGHHDPLSAQVLTAL